MGGKTKGGVLPDDHSKVHIKGTLFKIGHLQSATHIIYLFKNQQVTLEIQLIIVLQSKSSKAK